METPAKKPIPINIVIIAAVVCVVAVCATVVVLVLGNKDGETNTPAPGGLIGYAEGATVITDEDSLQAAIDEALANAQNSMVALSYKNNAYSTDGRNFDCYIANDPTNLYDMFLTIYADAEMTDQILLTGLVPPGSGFEKITLDHEMDTGTHTVYVALTQVDTEEDGTQVIKNQVVHTMDFHVS